MTDALEEDSGIVAFVDLLKIGQQVVEMAERVQRVDPAVPGTRANWSFVMSGARFDVVVSVGRATPHATQRSEG